MMATNTPMPKRVHLMLAEHMERSSAKRQEEKKPFEVQLDIDYGSLPSWADSVRPVPNVALRSALFGVMKKGERPYVERMNIDSQGGMAILYTGVLLDQGDLDVEEALLHLSQGQKWGVEIRVTAYGLLKVLGRTDTGKNRTILDMSLSRLKANALQVRVGDFSYEGSLIQEIYRDHDKRRARTYVIRLNPKLRVLFSGNQFTYVDWTIRQALRGKPLAQWLHGFYSSHAKSYDLKVETLHRLCGSRASSVVDFKKDLRRALEAVSQASINAGRPFSYLLDAQLVKITTTPSASQRRHLAKKR